MLNGKTLVPITGFSCSSSRIFYGPGSMQRTSIAREHPCCCRQRARQAETTAPLKHSPYPALLPATTTQGSDCGFDFYISGRAAPPVYRLPRLRGHFTAFLFWYTLNMEAIIATQTTLGISTNSWLLWMMHRAHHSVDR
jgi:hypothetical protein